MHGMAQIRGIHQPPLHLLAHFIVQPLRVRPALPVHGGPRRPVPALQYEHPVFHRLTRFVHHQSAPQHGVQAPIRSPLAVRRPAPIQIRPRLSRHKADMLRRTRPHRHHIFVGTRSLVQAMQRGRYRQRTPQRYVDGRALRHPNHRRRHLQRFPRFRKGIDGYGLAVLLLRMPVTLAQLQRQRQDPAAQGARRHSVLIGLNGRKRLGNTNAAPEKTSQQNRTNFNQRRPSFHCA